MIDVNRDNTALLITDPQNDFLSPDGATWSMVGENVTEYKTVENIEGLLKAAKENRIQSRVRRGRPRRVRRTRLRCEKRHRGVAPGARELAGPQGRRLATPDVAARAE